MAEKRMFARKIVDSGRFLRMPPTSRLLYYDLGMAADDDGIVEAYGVIRKNGCTEDDLRVLVAKGFVKILNEDLVSLIMDWKTNNTIQKDRYHPSVYASLVSNLETECIKPVSNLYPEVKVKDKIKIKDKVNNDQIPADFDREFERIWSLYPRKEGRKKALEAYVRARKKGTGAEEIESGVRRYLDHIRAERTEKKYVMQGSTYFSGQRWTDKYDEQREEYGELYDL